MYTKYRILSVIMCLGMVGQAGCELALDYEQTAFKCTAEDLCPDSFVCDKATHTCRMVCSDTTGRVLLSRADERAVWWNSAAALRHRQFTAAKECLTRSRHPRAIGGTAPPAQALSAVLHDAPSQRPHAKLSAEYPRLPPWLLSLQERRLEAEQALQTQILERRRTRKDAHLLHHGPGQRHGGDRVFGDAVGC